MIGAGARYFAIVFAIAFAAGAVRTIWVAPAVGATAAVLIELPIILAVSFFAARHIVARGLIRARSAALGAGAVAFALLMAAEVGLATLMSGQAIDIWFASLWRVPGIIGLGGQIMFGLMPALLFTPNGGKARSPLP